jgi:hypothetical protein
MAPVVVDCFLPRKSISALSSVAPSSKVPHAAALPGGASPLPQHSATRLLHAFAHIGGGRAVLVPFPPFVQHRRASVVSTAVADIIAVASPLRWLCAARWHPALAAFGYAALSSRTALFAVGRHLLCAFGHHRAASHRVRPNLPVNRTRRHMH